MDKILGGILQRRDLNDAVKEVVIQKVLNTPTKVAPTIDLAQSLIDFALSLLLCPPSPLHKRTAAQLLTKIELDYPTVISKHVTPSRYASYTLSSGNSFHIQAEALNVLVNLTGSRSMVFVPMIEVLLPELPSSLQLEVALILSKIPDVHQASFKLVNLSELLVEWLNNVTSASTTYDQDVSLLATLLVASWCNHREDKIVMSLGKMFQILCTYSSVSESMQVVLENAPVIPTLIHFVVSSQFPDVLLEKVIGRMLQWPLTKNTAQWIGTLMKELVSGKRLTVNVQVSKGAIVFVMKQLWNEKLQMGALSILRFMMLGYQHSPDLFHSFASLLPSLLLHLQHLPLPASSSSSSPSAPNDDTTSTTNNNINNKRQKSSDATFVHRDILLQLKNFTNSTSTTSTVTEPVDDDGMEKNITSTTTPSSSQSKQVIEELVEIAYISIYKHKLHMSLLELLSAYQQPSEQRMRQVLSDSAWTSLATESSSSYDSISKRAVGGKVGLKNLGNTCYLNSFLQSLFMTDPFRDALLSLNCGGVNNDNGLLCQLQRAFAHLLLTQRPFHVPKPFLHALPPMFKSGEQMDSSEFGKFLLDVLETELKGTEMTTLVEDLFVGEQLSKIRCLNCNRESPKMEKFVELALAFPEDSGVGEEKTKKEENNSKLNVHKMIEYYMSPEPLTGSNQYFCDSCHALHDAEKLTSIVRAPAHLMLTMKRFYYDPQKRARSKIMREVEYNSHLRVPQVVIVEVERGDGGGIVQEERIEEQDYYLYAVIMHTGGSAEYGHYYCYAKHSSEALPHHPQKEDDDDDDRGWFLFNDSSVGNATLKGFSGMTKQFKTSDVAYILFYRRSSFLPSRYQEIRPGVYREVIEDNAKFLKEIEDNDKLQQRQRLIVPSFPSYNGGGGHYGDDKSFGGGGGGFGGGGGGPFGGGGGRAVF